MRLWHGVGTAAGGDGERWMRAKFGRRWVRLPGIATSSEEWNGNLKENILSPLGGYTSIMKLVSTESLKTCIFQCSLDQTSRIHGPWRRDLSSSPTSPSSVSSETWHEISRPQVHGYDIVGAVFLDSLRFVSVADEKVARVFEAPKLFVRTLTALHIGNATNEVYNTICPRARMLLIFDILRIQMDRPAGASLPPLGLSNKAIKEGIIS
jgi:elongator complex protein 2